MAIAVNQGNSPKYWLAIHTKASIIKAKLVDRFHVRRGSVYGQQGCVIEYTVNDVQYRERIIVTKKAPIYDGTIGEEYDVYVVENEAKQEILLPVIPDVVKRVDIEGKKIVVKLLEGLI